jgi:hypothetical protein
MGKEKNWGCRCQRVHYPLYTFVDEGYMEAQYDFIEEPVSLYGQPSFDIKIKCEGDLQTISNPADGMRKCVKDNGVLKTGKIMTERGQAGYGAYNQ